MGIIQQNRYRKEDTYSSILVPYKFVSGRLLHICCQHMYSRGRPDHSGKRQMPAASECRYHVSDRAAPKAPPYRTVDNCGTARVPQSILRTLEPAALP